MTPPDLYGEPGWQPLAPFWELTGTQSFVSSDDGDRLRVSYFQDGDGGVWARAWFGPGAEGPPGHVHGGALAALMDEAMGMAALATGRVVVAARIEVDFRSMVPLGRTVTVELSLDGEAAADDHRAESHGGASRRVKIPVRATLRLAADVVACHASGLFVEIDTDRLGDALGRSPDASADTA